MRRCVAVLWMACTLYATPVAALTVLGATSAIHESDGTHITFTVPDIAIGLPDTTLFVWLTYRQVAAPITSAVGFTLIRNTLGASATGSASYIFRGTPASSYRWNSAGTGYASGGLIAVSDTVSVSPVDTWSENANAPASTTQTALSINTGTAGDLAIACWGFDSGALTLPVALTLQWNIPFASGVNYGSACGTKPMPTVGAVGDQAATNTVSTYYESQIVAILPAPEVRCDPTNPPAYCPAGWPCQTPTP